MVGDNVEVKSYAERLLETYSLEEILEMNDLTQEGLVETLIEAGLINADLPVVI